MRKILPSKLAFGIFDHLDEDGNAMARQYADRLTLTEACDRLGFYAYHLAEHHFSPHGRSPSPNLFLSSVAQRTRQLRLGPLVMLLSLSHPLRAFEEICMLDHLSGGRAELGIGRGSLPIELGYFGIDPDAVAGRYFEASEILMEAMRGGNLSYRGDHFELNNVPLILRPHHARTRRLGSPPTDLSLHAGPLQTAQMSHVWDPPRLFAGLLMPSVPRKDSVLARTATRHFSDCSA